jgi:hypothetical protein
MRARLICAAVALAFSPPAGATEFAQSTPAGSAAPFVLPPAGTTPRPLPAPFQLSMRGIAGWFRIGVPAAWQLDADRISGRIVVGGPSGRGIRLWLMMVPRSVEPGEAASLLAAANAQIAPRASWSPIMIARNGSQETATSHARDGDSTRATGISLVPAGPTTVAIYATAVAPTKVFDQSRDLFAAIFESFLPLPGYVAGAPGLERIDFDRWTDPVERAFSLDVPKGWKVRGGTVRRAANDVRQVVLAVNPEQSALIQFGDADIPPFIDVPAVKDRAIGPAPAMEAGSVSAFGRRYIGWRVRPLIPDLAIDAERRLPALQHRLQSIQSAYTTGGVERRVEAGELVFRGTWNDKPSRGYLFASITRIVPPNGRSMWIAGDFGSLQGIIAAEGRIPTAIAVMNRMRTSFETNPQWFRDNARAVESIARVATETGAHVADAVATAFGNDEVVADRSIYNRYAENRQRDVVPFKAPQETAGRSVQVGSNYYWIGERGLIFGTNTYFNPDPLWFRTMLTVSP